MQTVWMWTVWGTVWGHMVFASHSVSTHCCYWLTKILITTLQCHSTAPCAWYLLQPPAQISADFCFSLLILAYFHTFSSSVTTTAPEPSPAVTPTNSSAFSFVGSDKVRQYIQPPNLTVRAPCSHHEMANDIDKVRWQGCEHCLTSTATLVMSGQPLQVTRLHDLLSE